jgi:hypothetical protein
VASGCGCGEGCCGRLVRGGVCLLVLACFFFPSRHVRCNARSRPITTGFFFIPFMNAMPARPALEGFFFKKEGFNTLPGGVFLIPGGHRHFPRRSFSCPCSVLIIPPTTTTARSLCILVRRFLKKTEWKEWKKEEKEKDAPNPDLGDFFFGFHENLWFPALSLSLT